MTTFTPAAPPEQSGPQRPEWYVRTLLASLAWLNIIAMLPIVIGYTGKLQTDQVFLAVVGWMAALLVTGGIGMVVANVRKAKLPALLSAFLILLGASVLIMTVIFHVLAQDRKIGLQATVTVTRTLAQLPANLSYQALTARGTFNGTLSARTFLCGSLNTLRSYRGSQGDPAYRLILPQNAPNAIEPPTVELDVLSLSVDPVAVKIIRALPEASWSQLTFAADCSGNILEIYGTTPLN